MRQLIQNKKDKMVPGVGVGTHDLPNPNQVFTIVIWGDHRSKFGKPEDDYKEKRVCVSGKITAYAGLPEIVVEDPKQIRIDAEIS